MEHAHEHASEHACCHAPGEKKRIDYLFWGCLVIVVILSAIYFLFHSVVQNIGWLYTLCNSVLELLKTIWWGILLGALSVGLLSKIPREFIISILGNGGTLKGILRATLGGVFLDLCSHGILMVGAKLYERGASIGQVMSFLVASPWNSFSLTFILIALIGLKWTLCFIVLSMIIAVISGYIFDTLVNIKTLPANPNRIEISKDFHFLAEAKKSFNNTKFDSKLFLEIVKNGILESRMVVRWILFGVLLASAIRAFVPTVHFAEYFGPTLLGLGLTLVAATIIEVCSEGSTPIAADLLTRAGSPGNSFAFLMAGVSTDYTELAVIKQATQSWKITLLLPILTIPQVFVVAYFLNSSVQ
ncbi:MAG: ATPase [Candidatus Dadabacteria bacterium]|nr:ATPase [Candidatus Dadabacteria bacterium]NIS08988.1 ATPase [Candidatus Dadabacteria bacterium]NIV41031.1 ATPase [Candidatus Dadabacteria bacterium]NIX15590.1 ATPase [Candidatus Dadabacteria bacterium]NIY22331.1 ATPase [Candidatus Dadabacteria bacterium]